MVCFLCENAGGCAGRARSPEKIELPPPAGEAVTARHREASQFAGVFHVFVINGRQFSRLPAPVSSDGLRVTPLQAPTFLIQACFVSWSYPFLGFVVKSKVNLFPSQIMTERHSGRREPSIDSKHTCL